MRLPRLILVAGLLTGLAVTAHAAPPYRRLVFPSITDVRIVDRFFAPRMATCRDVTLSYCFNICNTTGRITNFVKAAGRMPGKFEGIWFNDSDVYKVLEGAAYQLAVRPDAKLNKLTDDVIAKIAAAQQPDGYLFCFFTIDNAKERFKNIVNPARHELYCMGHMIEAGAVHFEMTGKRNMLDVACRLADHIDSIFGPGKRLDVPEHQELELALIRLYRVTREKRYLDLAAFFINQRGNQQGHKLYGAYSQDHRPVRQQDEIVGHAVRAMYNCIGMADLYMETGDQALLDACKRLWRSTTFRKMYITGGVGATARGEAFGPDYQLPNATAYSETCAQIGLLLFAHRMFLIEPRAEYVDVMERVLYNGFLSGLSLSGDKFFYQNRLATSGDYRRQAWYGCACCPSNVVRIYPRIGQFAYARDDDAIFVNLYIGSTAKFKVRDKPVSIVQKTGYPWHGNVKLTVNVAEQQQFELLLRVPGWCKDEKMPGDLYHTATNDVDNARVKLSINGQAMKGPKIDDGYLRLRRDWQPGDVVELDLPMPIRRVYAHKNIKDNVGRVALQRGPIVYCVEAVDHDNRVDQLILPRQTKLAVEDRPDMLGGVTAITGKAAVRLAGSDALKPVDLLAIPYYAWDNRAGGQMAVWLPEDPQLAAPIPKPTIASRARASASHCWDRDSLRAINDQIEPRKSHDLTVPRHTWWDHRGTQEWVQYDLAESTNVSSVEVYWFDDRQTGHCWVPESWRLLARVNGTWEPVKNPSSYGMVRDRRNRVTFDPTETDALRIETQLRENCSGGVLEWHVGAAP